VVSVLLLVNCVNAGKDFSWKKEIFHLRLCVDHEQLRNYWEYCAVTVDHGSINNQ